MFTKCTMGTYKNGNIIQEKRVNVTEWEDQSNSCYEFLCDIDNGFIIKKRNNASQWEKQSNECFEYICDNESGLIGWSKCNSTDKMNRTCVNGKCIESKTIIDNKWSVIIEMENAIKAIELNVSEFITEIIIISGMNETVDINEIIITTEIEIDENGDIINIIIHVDNEEIANTISEVVESKMKEGCEGIICRTKRVRVEHIETNEIISKANCKVIYSFIIMIIIIIMLYLQ